MVESICERTSDLTVDDRPIQVTGIVVTYNEARRLRECLNSLAFCDQLIVVDLGSTDDSIKIAQEYKARVVHHEWVPVVEKVWPDIEPHIQHNWVLRADPDEVITSRLGQDIIRLLEQVSSDVAMVNLPHQYYLLGEPLHTTFWGGIQFIGKIFHRQRVELHPHVHRGIQIHEGFRTVTIPFHGSNIVQHYWIDSIPQLFKKHWRYIKQEGASQYHAGRRFRGWRGWLRDTWYALQRAFVRYQGYKGGWRELFLSFFYVWYVSSSALSLWWYQRQRSATRGFGKSEED